jgi:hypothetical protein
MVEIWYEIVLSTMIATADLLEEELGYRPGIRNPRYGGCADKGRRKNQVPGWTTQYDLGKHELHV